MYLWIVLIYRRLRSWNVSIWQEIHGMFFYTRWLLFSRFLQIKTYWSACLQYLFEYYITPYDGYGLANTSFEINLVVGRDVSKVSALSKNKLPHWWNIPTFLDGGHKTELLYVDNLDGKRNCNLCISNLK